MYTATLKGDVTDKVKRRRIITVTFANEIESFDKTFEFGLSVTELEMKKAVKYYLDELNTVPAPITGDITNVPAPEPETPKTQAELDKEAWDIDLGKLKVVQELIDLGILTGNETPVVNLRNKVKADFKPAYIA